MSEPPPPSARSGLERAAILLMTLGEQDAAAVLKELNAKEVQSVGSAMAKLAGLSRTDVNSTLEKFSSDFERHTSVGVGSDAYVRKVLVEALGQDKANSIVDRILGGRSSRGLEALKWMDSKSVAEMLRYEHPQIIAIVLSYLNSDQAAEVLNALLDELDYVLEKQFSGGSTAKSAGFGGAKVAAGILNLLGSASEAVVLEEITSTDPVLAQKLQDLMFVFEDVTEIEDRGMQELLREVPGDKLIIALKAADDATKQHFFKNMSQRAAEMLRDDLESKGPVKLSEVEAAQKEILLIARRLSDEGRIAIGGKGGEEYV
jgi:flagellar motor switch protein FliG